MREDYKTKPMTQEEVKEALKLFNAVIKKGVITYEHANPMQENCYISSGDYEGVYFPNSEIKMSFDTESFICVCKYGYIYNNYQDKIGVLYDYECENPNIGGVYFISFDELLYTRFEREIREEMIKRINECKKDLITLKSIRFITKKDGKYFQDLLKNIDKSNGVKYWWTNKSVFNSWVEFWTQKGATITLYNCVSVEAMQEEIKKDIESKEKFIKECEKQIKITSKLDKALNDFNKKLNDLGVSLSIKKIIQDNVKIRY